MSTIGDKHSVGELRPSQLLHTFGIGAIIDLPHLSTMVMGIDDWSVLHATEIGEERLLQAVRAELGPQVASLRLPPIQTDNSFQSRIDGSVPIGVPVTTFPRWMVCPYCRLLAPRDSSLFQLKADLMRPDRTRYVHANCTKPGVPPTVLPARFLVACERGHLDDFPWHYFVHGGASACVGALRLLEFGVSGEASDIVIKCDGCQQSRRMSEAFGEDGRQSMPTCRGYRPHLRDFDGLVCTEQMTTILLGASNSWFGLTLSALSVPVAVDTLGQLIDTHWHILEKAGTREVVTAFRAIGQLSALSAFSDDEVWTAVERKRGGTTGDPEPRSLKAPEWRVFTNPDHAPQLDDFQIRAIDPPSAYRAVLRRVVLVEKLREVSATVGFTRIASPGDFADGGELPPEQRAPLSRRAVTWVPAVEVRGEGLFLEFDENAISQWLAAPQIQAYERDAFAAHVQWRRARRLPEPRAGYPGARYILLHSFAHALMRQLALESGYTIASIRERVYALKPTDDDGPMAGVLLYTAAPDSEGTLGGLVSLGEPQWLSRHLDKALDAMRLCASDPLCAEHTAAMEPQTLHDAACHACLFSPETSCERGNRYLDRTLLVPTVDNDSLAFFRGEQRGTA